VVKNEADIIELCLQEASKWSDHIYIYDNGSTDGTWEKALSLKNEIIIPWKQDDKPFQESLRGEVFNAFEHKASPGDWWCRLDSDEFYTQSPKHFLTSVKRGFHVVWGIAIEYYLSLKDVNSIDFSLPVSQIIPQIQFYKAENSEPRFFMHRKGLTWDANGAWPHHMGLVNPDRILYRHYKYRTPDQIQKRLNTRRDARAKGFTGWDHAKDDDWQQKLVNSEELHYDSQDGHYIIDVAKLPSHMEPVHKRLMKRFMHGVGIWP
jgi:glycosyltransferase involved in cell wall biosynthesis